MGDLADSDRLSPDKSDITKGHNKVLAHLPVRQQNGISRYPYRAPAILVPEIQYGASVSLRPSTCQR